MLFRKLNLILSRFYPHGSTQFAKIYFSGKLINAIEIGVYQGDNSKSILKELNINELILIDPYKNYNIVYGRKDLKKDYQGLKLRKARDRVRYMVNKDTRLTLIEESSDQAFKKLKEYLARFDFIYIDGNHAYDFVLRDMENYYKLLANGGLLCGDDIDQPEVFRAVRDFSKKYNKDVKIWGLNWIIIK